MTDRELRVLFVCTGNTCRSPMAEGFFNALAAEKGIPAKASSAGAAAYAGNRASENARIAAKMLGADISGHRSRLLDREVVSSADRIYTMNDRLASAIVRAFDVPEEKLAVLGNGIEDPFGGDLDVYLRCAEQIKNAVAGLPVFQEFK